MKMIKTVKEMYDYTGHAKKKGQKVGLVPTMGYLHEGHLSLIRAAKKDCDLIVTSIFVNPIQFGIGEDYEDYPRDLTRDAALAQEAGAGLIFAPSVGEMYPAGYRTFVHVEGLTDYLCGTSRPGHFRGVTTVVMKLFHIVQPHLAYFGQKDAQQVTVIERMVEDLNIPVRIVRVPIVREKDGLALSSRNLYLNHEERQQAPVLYRALREAETLVEKGERKVSIVKDHMKDMISRAPLASIDYVEIVDGKTMEPVEVIKGKILIALAVKFGKTRLIDNVLLEV